MTGAPSCSDPVVLDEWHPIAALAEITPSIVHRTLLLGDSVSYTRTAAGDPLVWRSGNETSGDIAPASVVEPLATCVKYGYVWTTLGCPRRPLFDIPECDEPDRRTLNGGSIIVQTSAPRAVENFLDMGHFPFVHTGILGAEPRTEVLGTLYQSPGTRFTATGTTPSTPPDHPPQTELRTCNYDHVIQRRALRGRERTIREIG